MDPSLQELLRNRDLLKDEFRDIGDGVRKALHIASTDPEMALTRCRLVLEHIIHDVYERSMGEPPAGRALDKLIQRLVRAGYFPERLDAYAALIRKMGNAAVHGRGH